MSETNNNTKSINPKCSKCKCYFIQDDFKSSGLPYSTCKKCRGRDKISHEKNKCIHDKYKSQCKLCGGSQICEHDKKRSQCKLCSGGSICEHDKIRSQCKLCGGSQICEHDKRRSICKLCGGGSICEHQRERSTCKLCGGSKICEHDKQRNSCKICNFKLYLVNLQRGQIKRCFNNSNLTKSKHSIEYLDCTIQELIDMFNTKIKYFNDYLASDVIMTWGNIHLDHVKPVSKFNLDDEEVFLDCCHYSNLQPLLINGNLEKSNKWSYDNEKYWL